MNGWVRLPRRLVEAVERGDLTIFDLGLLGYLKSKADYRTGLYTVTLTDLKAATRSPGKRTEYLRRRLHALRDAGELAFL